MTGCVLWTLRVPELNRSSICFSRRSICWLQPFKLGDRVSVSYSASTPGVSSGISGGWFEGVCEKVDLRYGRCQRPQQLSSHGLWSANVAIGRVL